VKTWIIVGLIMAMAASLVNAWQKHEASTPAHQIEFDRQIIALHQEHADWTSEQIAIEIAREAARIAGIRVLVTELIVLILFAVLHWRLGVHWWYLAVAFALWIGAIFCGVSLNWV
jgi:hypothetical protein